MFVAVEVDEEHGGTEVVLTALFDGELDPVGNEAAVGQFGQWVVKAVLPDRLFSLFFQGQVPDKADGPPWCIRFLSVTGTVESLI